MKQYEPALCDETVYENDEYTVKRIWTWEVEFLYEDEETGIIRALSGFAFNYEGVSTFVTKEGKRICDLEFDYMDSFHEGMVVVGKNGCGYGFIDKEMHLAIPMRYDDAEPFYDGMAKVKKEGQWLYIDKAGREIVKTEKPGNSKYVEIGEYFDGMCAVATVKLDIEDMAYHSEFAFQGMAGVWGFINEAGDEVIRPQYIYAFGFHNGIAIVCRGKWEKSIDEDGVLSGTEAKAKYGAASINRAGKSYRSGSMRLTGCMARKICFRRIPAAGEPENGAS